MFWFLALQLSKCLTREYCNNECRIHLIRLLNHPFWPTTSPHDPFWYTNTSGQMIRRIRRITSYHGSCDIFQCFLVSKESVHWLIDCLTDLSIRWLIDWFTYGLFYLRMGLRHHLPIIKTTRLYCWYIWKLTFFICQISHIQRSYLSVYVVL